MEVNIVLQGSNVLRSTFTRYFNTSNTSYSDFDDLEKVDLFDIFYWTKFGANKKISNL